MDKWDSIAKEMDAVPNWGVQFRGFNPLLPQRYSVVSLGQTGM